MNVPACFRQRPHDLIRGERQVGQGFGINAAEAVGLFAVSECLYMVQHVKIVVSPSDVAMYFWARSSRGGACCDIVNEANSGYREGRAAAPNIECEGAGFDMPFRTQLAYATIICQFSDLLGRAGDRQGDFQDIVDSPYGAVHAEPGSPGSSGSAKSCPVHFNTSASTAAQLVEDDQRRWRGKSNCRASLGCGT